MASLEIGGIALPYDAGDRRLVQDYSPKSEGSLLELGDGSSHKQILQGFVGKLNTVIRGSEAWTQAALAGLDYTRTMILRCAVARGVTSVSNIINIPAKRRTDSEYIPLGYGLVYGEMVPTEVSMAGNVATLTPVPGATFYVVNYWPEIEVYATFTESTDASVAHSSWTLTCREK